MRELSNKRRLAREDAENTLGPNSPSRAMKRSSVPKLILFAFALLLGGCSSVEKTEKPVAPATVFVEPSDDEVWSFIVYLYGYDDESLQSLNAMSAAERAALIATMKEADRIAEGKYIKPLRELTHEERKFLIQMRGDFGRSDRELNAAIKRGLSLTDEEIRQIVELSELLVTKHLIDKSWPVYGRGGERPIPHDWEFLAPLRISVFGDGVSIWLYFNVLAQWGPQVQINVSVADDRSFREVRFSDNLGTSKTWRMPAPLAR